MKDFKEKLGWFVGRLNYLLTRTLNDRHCAHNTGITADQFRLLCHLWREDGQPQQNLALGLGRDRGTVTRMVDILEDAGVVTRIADKDDRRVNLVYLTKKGKSLETPAHVCGREAIEQMTKGFTAEEYKIFASLLQKAIKNLE